MKRSFFTLGVVLSLVSCNTEEITEEVIPADPVAQELAQKVVANREITVLDPITLGPDDLIQGGSYSTPFIDINGNVIPIDDNRGSLLLPTFNNGILSYPRNGQLQSDRYKPAGNGRWELITDRLEGFSTPVPNVNRWHMIDGTPYFLLDGGDLRPALNWFRIIPGQPMNVENLERVAFRDRTVRFNTTPIGQYDDDYADFIKRTVLFASTPESEDLGFFYVNFATNIPLLVEGYDNLPVEVDARSFGGATITKVEFWVDGRRIRTDTEAPYVWGGNGNESETLGLSGGTFSMRHRFGVRATDSEGRRAIVRLNFTVRTQESILNPFSR